MPDRSGDWCFLNTEVGGSVLAGDVEFLQRSMSGVRRSAPLSIPQVGEGPCREIRTSAELAYGHTEYNWGQLVVHFDNPGTMTMRATLAVRPALTRSAVMRQFDVVVPPGESEWLAPSGELMQIRLFSSSRGIVPYEKEDAVWLEDCVRSDRAAVVERRTFDPGTQLGELREYCAGGDAGTIAGTAATRSELAYRLLLSRPWTSDEQRARRCDDFDPDEYGIYRAPIDVQRTRWLSKP